MGQMGVIETVTYGANGCETGLNFGEEAMLLLGEADETVVHTLERARDAPMQSVHVLGPVLGAPLDADHRELRDRLLRGPP